MGAIEDRIKELGHTLPGPSAPGGNYVSAVAVPSAGLVYTAGNVARRPDGTMITGKLGADLTVEQGYEAARLCALNSLANLKEAIGDLDRVVHFVKVLGMVNADPEFGKTPEVINGYSDLLVEVFGERGRHARSAVGMATLPFGIAVEVEAIVEVEG